MTRILLTTLVFTLMTLDGSHAVASPPTDEPAAQAEALYAARRYLEAARAFEALAPTHGKYLYFAGLAHEAVGHDGQAIEHWRRVASDPAVEPGLREQARARAERAEARTTRLFLSVTPAAAAFDATVELSAPGRGDRRKRVLKLARFAEGVHLEGSNWTIEVRGAGQEYAVGRAEVTLSVREAEKRLEIALMPIKETVLLTISPPTAVAALPQVTLVDDAGIETSLAFSVNQATSRLQLRRGLWRYRIEAPGFAPVQGEVQVRAGRNTELTLKLTPRAPRTRALAIGAGVSSLLFAGGGAVGLGLSEHRLTALRTAGTYGVQYDTASARGALDGLQFSSIAAGVSVGFLVTTVTAAVRRDRLRRRAWAAEVTLGSLMAAGGAAWAGLAFKDWKRHLNAPEPGGARKSFDVGELDTYRTNFYPSMLMIGTGAALFLGAVAGLALEHRKARKPRGYARAPRLRLLFPLTLDF